MTREQKLISKKNWRKARKHFGIKSGDYLVLHHIDITLQDRDIERYIEWRPEDLVVMTQKEHNKLHAQGENNSMYGSHRCGGENPRAIKVLCVETGELYDSIGIASFITGIKCYRFQRWGTDIERVIEGLTYKRIYE